MTAQERASAFLRRHSMHPSQLSLPELSSSFRREMDAGLAGEPSSLGMLPSFLSAASRPHSGRVLAIDAGGTRLRLARLSLSPEGRLCVEELRRTEMPGVAARLTPEEMFAAIARELLPLLADCDRGCFCFSYPCEVLPDGDGRVLRLTKELHVEGLPGRRLCRGLEDALLALGASGQRRWRVINDTVGTMLCGMAETAAAHYHEHIGFILGTGFNTCAHVALSAIPGLRGQWAEGEMIVNYESGGFDKLLRGTGDCRLDRDSECPGSQLAEKMISGGYFPALLRTTLLLGAEEGELRDEDGAWLRDAPITMAEVGQLCAAPRRDDPFAPLGADNRAFASAVNVLLLERGAKIAAGMLLAMILSRGLPAGSRVCICADGTPFAKNPLLRPRTEFYLSSQLSAHGITADFCQVSDATLLGAGYAALLD